MSSPSVEALLKISDTIAGARDLKELLRLLAPALKKAVDFDYIAVFLHDSEKDLMRLHLVEQFSDAPTPEAVVVTEGSPAGLCFLSQQSLIIDVDSETRFLPDVMAIVHRFNIKSICCQPLTTSGR